MRNWDEYFESTKKLLEEREEARKNYDHYEAKLETLQKRGKGSEDPKLVRVSIS